MSKYRQAAKVDSNQAEIVKKLRQIGAHIVTGHDDLLVYFGGDLYQIELKEKSPFTKKGTFRVGDIKPSQFKLLANANDKYAICWSFDQVETVIRGHLLNDHITPSSYRANWQKWHGDRLTPEQKADIHFSKWREGL